MTTPFAKDQELCDKLEVQNGQIQRRAHVQNGQTPVQKTYLPGAPRIQLSGPQITEHLQAELVTADLNKMAPYLWLMTTQSSRNVSPLTEQLVRGRKVVVSENPGLHLVWVHDRVFLKPLPKCLLSYDFWNYYLLSVDSPIPQPERRELVKAAYGFLRSYAYLIQHKSDFVLATREETRLIPKNVSHTDFVAFIVNFVVDDAQVSRRYHFGEIRLTRLNFWSKLFLSKPVYQQIEWQYAAYFAQFYAPALFIFATFSLLLSASQAILAVQSIVNSGHSWFTFARVSRGISIFIILFVACVIVYFLVLLLNLVSKEVSFALKSLFRLRRHRVHPDQENEAVVNQ